MQIFLDTNVFLSFYHLTSDDLEELKKLVVLAREGKVTIHLPEQVLQEFHRNRAVKIADALKRLRDHKFKLQFPQMSKAYPEYEKLQNAQRESKKQHAELLDKIEADAGSEGLEADSVIEELFNVAKTISTTDELLSRARNRRDLGNPPGKKESLGDQVNWEALLDSVPAGEDLYLIADDGDFFSPLDGAVLDPYLHYEWEEKKESEIYPYRRLSSFFQEHFADIELASELEKDLLIQELANSESFAKTHVVISKLSRYSEFTQSQVNEIVAAAVSNEQIYWIARDEDVHQFLASVVHGREDQIDHNNLARIQYVLEAIEPYGEIPF